MTDTIERKVVHLPGTILTPEVALARTMQKLPRIKAVTIVIQWDDDTFDCDWSSMKTSELCMASKVLDRQVDEAIEGVAE